MLLLLFSGCQSKNPSIKIIISSDIHYFSDSLRDNGELFSRLAEEGDGRLIHYTVPIVDAFLAQVIKEKPDALVLTGDLTFNGEKQSHIELAEKLKMVKEQGIAVYVLPGNHDINNPYAKSYIGKESGAVENISPEEFAKIYASLGFDDALSREEHSLSYSVSLGERIQLYLTDTNLYSPDSWSSGGMFGENQLEWLDESLSATSESGGLPIMFSHHNIIDHSSSLSFGYTAYDGNKVTRLYQKHNALLNFSGHIHMQNIAKENNIYDVATSSLLINPTQYGVLLVDETTGTMEYETALVDMESWAKKTGFADENIRNYDIYSYNLFWKSTFYKFYSNLLSTNSVELADKLSIAWLIANINSLYFSGNPEGNWNSILTSEEYKLWDAYGEDAPFRNYIDSILEDNESHVSLSIVYPQSS